jgi:hypothetical protein
MILLFLLPLFPFALWLFGALLFQLFWPVLLVIFVIWLVVRLVGRRE